MVTIENEYYLRTILLLCEAGSYIAKLLIGRELPKFDDDLNTLLKNAKGKLQHEFHKRQMEKLFPNDGYDKTDVDKWDIQMLVGVLLLLFRSTLSSDEKQKLREIKLIRHEVLAHSPSASLYLEKYEDVSEQLREAIKLLASGFGQEVQDECKNYISIYATHSLDVTSAIKRLQEAKDTDDLFQTVIRVVTEVKSSLSKQISAVRDNVREDVKHTVKALTKKFEAIGTEVKSSQQTSSDGFKSVEKNIKETKQTLKKKIDLVEGSIVVTRETLAKKIEKIEGISCDTYDSLADLRNKIEDVQQMLLKAESVKHSNESELSASELSNKLKLKSAEVQQKMLTFEIKSSQPYKEVWTAAPPASVAPAAPPASVAPAAPPAAVAPAAPPASVAPAAPPASVAPAAPPASVAPAAPPAEGRHFRLPTDYSNENLVVAIDIGTSFSGFVISYGEFNPCKMITKMYTAGTCLRSGKTPTTVLFDKDGQFHSFGYDAETKYSDLAKKDCHREWYLFQRFKMALYNQEKITGNLTIQAINGKSMKAMDVFRDVIQYFMQDALSHIRLHPGSLNNHKISWVLTVPAIWTDSAKGFMREAAQKAGINDENLRIAFEPEAASVYCQTMSIMTNHPGSSILSCIRSGQKYMVIDIGGGTTDITVHEKQTDDSLIEVYKASGGAWGGIKVDVEILQLIRTVFGENIFSKFSQYKLSDYLDLKRQIEKQKRNDVPQGNDYITLRLPFSLLNMFEEENNQKAEKAVQKAGFSGKIIVRGDKMRINADTWAELFKPCCDEIINHISDILSHPAVQGTSVFLMVGGFSSCNIIQNGIKRAFPKINVFIPEETETAVMKGAVLSGFCPRIISTRISKYTYGISVSPLFDSSIHSNRRKVTIGGKVRCKNVFMKYVTAGQEFTVNDTRCAEHSTVLPYQREVELKLYCTPKPNPMYVDEEGVIYLGKLVVDIPTPEEEKVVSVELMFSESEISVEVTELPQGRLHKLKVILNSGE